LGGPCIPVNPYYLSWAARRHGTEVRLIEAAAQVNDGMPRYVVERVASELALLDRTIEGARILLLGIAYKRDVGDPRESPAFKLLELLLENGAIVVYNDPHVPELPQMRRWPHRALRSLPLTPETLTASDCVIIVTDHTAYDWGSVAKHAKLVVDTRN